MEFTYDAYRKLIDTALKNGYKICSYENVDDNDKCVILRHDIDFSPNKALEIAKIEYEMGVKSTYFVLLSTEFYNVFSIESSGIFAEILDMGHQIGLHFDEQRYKTISIEQIKEHIYKETKILGRALSTQINVVSMHRPSKFTLDASIVLDGLINSYSHKYFKDMKYLSDSRMYWREDSISVVSSNQNNKIHILTHPFWYSDEVENIQDKLNKFLNEANVFRYDLLDKNFRVLIVKEN